MPSYKHQQRRPISMPPSYEDDTSMSIRNSKPSSSRLYSQRLSRASAPMSRAIPRNIQPSGPSMPIPIPANPNVIPGNTLPSAPASPPTPAPSPTPGQRGPDWSTATPHEDMGLPEDTDSDGAASTTTLNRRSSRRAVTGLGYRHMRGMFAEMDNEERKRMLAELLNMCDGKQLSFVAAFVGPRLKRDPFGVLPNELCLRVSL